ncbi:MAG: hypothetical protein CMO74_09300 [Verrucomicrobiales bacterium]|nr:hypothetical protein [Verrucomicrobiales bacterium]MBL68624.1 hypothetical protein [Verrucomicrobiales bacterium]|tara:strand:+ start:891 stop:1946 length:1056 start_codon:yes stop_codon:yes gene_type:complete
MKTTCAFILTALFLSANPASAANGLWTDPKDPTLPLDFKVQGEYIGEQSCGCTIGAQVIALGGGAFQAVLYPLGLPGGEWDKTDRTLLAGKLVDGKAVFETATGKRRYLGNKPSEFSATKQFPPKGHKTGTATIENGKMTGIYGKKKFVLERIVRKADTLGTKPPKGAVVLFDGSNKDEWLGGRLDAKTKLLNTDGRDIKTKRSFGNYHMHVEFLLPFKPAARGQGRGNSGFYQVDHYEVQILDSFGLEGEHNECGGIYSKRKSDVNACLPPLQWQAYDVDFTLAETKDGKKVKNARVTVRLNGVVIHDNVEIPGKTGGSRGGAEGTPGPIKLQGHGNPLQFRNVWIVEKK